MRKTTCATCNTEVPLNESIKINGKIYCDVCAASSFSDKKNLEGMSIEKGIDPTVCSSCNNDFGNVVLNKIATYPVCPECEIKIKNRTFPLWVKAFIAGILLITAFAFYWNWKYYQGYNDVKSSNTYFAAGDYEHAAASMKAASKKVPEVKDVETLATFFSGINLLTKDKSDQALVEFNKCKPFLGTDLNIDTYILQARIGASFDKKDYEGFLEAAKENLVMDTSSAISWTSVASAYACIYVARKNDSARLESEKCIMHAKLIDSSSAEMKQYYNMIAYRIYSRKIIRREEFMKQFPHGWTKN